MGVGTCMLAVVGAYVGRVPLPVRHPTMQRRGAISATRPTCPFLAAQTATALPVRGAYVGRVPLHVRHPTMQRRVALSATRPTSKRRFCRSGSAAGAATGYAKAGSTFSDPPYQ